MSSSSHSLPFLVDASQFNDDTLYDTNNLDCTTLLPILYVLISEERIRNFVTFVMTCGIDSLTIPNTAENFPWAKGGVETFKSLIELLYSLTQWRVDSGNDDHQQDVKSKLSNFFQSTKLEEFWRDEDFDQPAVLDAFVRALVHICPDLEHRLTWRKKWCAGKRNIVGRINYELCIE